MVTLQCFTAFLIFDMYYANYKIWGLSGQLLSFMKKKADKSTKQSNKSII